MSKTEKKRWIRYQSLLELKEPYEMTYWKNKLNAPGKKVMNYIRSLIEIITKKPLPDYH